MKKFQDACCLVIDASGSTVFVGICQEGSWLSLQSAQLPALESIPQLLESAFKQAKPTLDDIECILVCSGPGSVLGTRVTTVTVRAWQAANILPQATLYQYESLTILAAQLEYKQEVAYPFHIISESRNKRWNLLSIPAPSQYQAIEEVERSRLEELTGNIVYLPQAKRNKDLPERASLTEYTLTKLPQLLGKKDLFKKVESPEPFAHSAPRYHAWTAERHRKPH